MFGWIKGLFTAKSIAKNGATLAKDLSKGVDMMFYTDEEKEQYRQKVADMWLEAMTKMNDENSARSITRRILSVLVLTQYCVFLYAIAIIWPFNPDWAGAIFELVEHEWIIVVTVIGFYFGPYFLSYLFGGKKDGTKRMQRH